MNNLEAARARLAVLQLPVTKYLYRNSLEGEVATDLEAALRVVERLMQVRDYYKNCRCCGVAYFKHAEDCPLVWWEKEAP